MKKKMVQILSLVLASVTLIGTPLTTEAATWKKNSKGWWYQNDDHSWPANQWKKISGKWYYFNGSGYMVTGWKKLSGKWYYMNGSGAMTTGWQKVSGKWYYMNSSGAMTTGWQKVSGKWYYMNSSGAMTTGWQKVSGKWYYMNSSGAMQANTWIGNYYVTGSGAMATNCWIGSTYVDGTGKKTAKQTQTTQSAKWMKDSNGWWYRNADGSYPADQWMKIDNVWYHFNDSGYMETNTWIDGWYYVTGSGAMAVNTWIGDAYVGADGRYIPYYGEDREEEPDTITVCRQCGYYTTDVELMDYHLLYEGHSCSWYSPHTHVWEETTITLYHHPVWHYEYFNVNPNELEANGWTEEDVDCYVCLRCGLSMYTREDADKHVLETGQETVTAHIVKTVTDQEGWTETKQVRKCPQCHAVKGNKH